MQIYGISIPKINVLKAGHVISKVLESIKVISVTTVAVHQQESSSATS
jgi:hypothetical protein